MKLYTDEEINEIVSKSETELCRLMGKYKSDKGTQHHNYTLFYDHIFKEKRNEPVNILEIGIGSMNPGIISNMTGVRGYKPGGSIRAWRDYFPRGELYCCDIDKEIIDFSDEERIYGFYMDQTDNYGIYQTLFFDPKLKDVKFDIIIDDGIHHFPTNVHVMHTLIPKLKPSGIYVIEDILDYNEKMVARGLPYKWQYIKLPNPYNEVDNNLFVVKKEK